MSNTDVIEKLEVVNDILNRLATQGGYTSELHYNDLATAVWKARNLIQENGNGQTTEENTVSKADLY